MEIQELLNILSNVTIELTGIKMDKVTGQLKASEAKKKCAEELKKARVAEHVQNSINEWSALK